MASRSQPPCEDVNLRFLVNHNEDGYGDTKDQDGAWRLLSGIWQPRVLTRLGLGFTKDLEILGIFFMFFKQKQYVLFPSQDVLCKVAKAILITRQVVKLQKLGRVFMNFPIIFLLSLI